MTDEATLTIAFLDHAPAVAAQELQGLPIESAAALIESVPTRLSAPVLNAMIPWHAANLLGAISAARAAGVLRHLSFADSISLTRLVAAAQRNEIFEALPGKWSRRLKSALEYPQHQVGAWIDPEVPILSVNDTVSAALQTFAAAESASHVFVESEGHEEYVGVVSVSEVIRSDASATMQQLSISRAEPISNRATLSTLVFDDRWDDCLHLPVVGRRGNLLGGLSRKTLRHALHEAHHASDDRKRVSFVREVAVAFGLTCLSMIRLAGSGNISSAVDTLGGSSHEQ